MIPSTTTVVDDAAFADAVDRYRPELRAHCHRLLRSAEGAEDAVQETFLRAWRSLPDFEGRSSLRTWLYRIATNACIDATRRGRPEREHTAQVEPDHDEPHEPVAPSDHEPDALLLAKESATLGLLTAVAVLPPRQRAVLILRDVLRWSARETAGLLDTTEAAVNSALQRAHATLQDLGPEPRSAAADPDDAIERCRCALERGDPTAALLLGSR